MAANSTYSRPGKSTRNKNRNYRCWDCGRWVIKSDRIIVTKRCDKCCIVVPNVRKVYGRA